MLSERLDHQQKLSSLNIMHNHPIDESDSMKAEQQSLDVLPQREEITLTERPVERLEREDIMVHSMALATNKSLRSTSASEKVTEESQALINLDKSYGVKLQGQYIEKEFSYSGGFSNIKNKKKV